MKPRAEVPAAKPHSHAPLQVSSRPVSPGNRPAFSLPPSRLSHTSSPLPEKVKSSPEGSPELALASEKPLVASLPNPRTETALGDQSPAEIPKSDVSQPGEPVGNAAPQNPRIFIPSTALPQIEVPAESWGGSGGGAQKIPDTLKAPLSAQQVPVGAGGPRRRPPPPPPAVLRQLATPLVHPATQPDTTGRESSGRHVEGELAGASASASAEDGAADLCSLAKTAEEGLRESPSNVVSAEEPQAAAATIDIGPLVPVSGAAFPPQATIATPSAEPVEGPATARAVPQPGTGNGAASQTKPAAAAAELSESPPDAAAAASDASSGFPSHRPLSAADAWSEAAGGTGGGTGNQSSGAAAPVPPPPPPPTAVLLAASLPLRMGAHDLSQPVARPGGTLGLVESILRREKPAGSKAASKTLGEASAETPASPGGHSMRLGSSHLAQPGVGPALRSPGDLSRGFSTAAFSEHAPSAQGAPLAAAERSGRVGLVGFGGLVDDSLSRGFSTAAFPIQGDARAVQPGESANSLAYSPSAASSGSSFGLQESMQSKQILHKYLTENQSHDNNSLQLLSSLHYSD